MEFEEAVDEFNATGSVKSMDCIIESARDGRLSDLDIAYLAKQLAASGCTVQRPHNEQYVDIASTGGPSSLSTLLCPLFLIDHGFVVPKLGVPGRPAGGIDSLAQLPGFLTQMDVGNVTRTLERCQYAHFLANDDFAPRDRQLFEHRKLTGAINIPDLAIASLLSKKIAVGISRVGLDVRVAAHGNFGTSFNEARLNAMKFNRVSRLVGIDSKCFLTDGTRPFQPYIGRGEALMAIASIINGDADEWLSQHYRQCFAMAREVSQLDASVPSGSQIRQIWTNHLQTQGSSFEEFTDVVSRLKNEKRTELIAESDGFLRVNLGKLRSAIVQMQDLDECGDPFPDSAGVIIKRQAGQFVCAGETIATYRNRLQDSGLLASLREAFPVTKSLHEEFGIEVIENA